jgi:hypothetical protein
LQFQKKLLEKESKVNNNDDDDSSTRKSRDAVRAKLASNKLNARAQHKKELEKRDEELVESVVGKQRLAAALAALRRCTTYLTNVYFYIYVMKWRNVPVMQRRNVLITA